MIKRNEANKMIKELSGPISTAREEELKMRFMQIISDTYVEIEYDNGTVLTTSRREHSPSDIKGN